MHHIEGPQFLQWVGVGVVESEPVVVACVLLRAAELDVEVVDVVRINSGVFENYTGTISEIDAEKGRLKVLVEETPIELGFDQVETL